ncbi:hypothetical protein E4U53_004147 [Claviceps sorghi]|nr:hypothetical protein E4U53_004147 [Claviceps sorghi]
MDISSFPVDIWNIIIEKLVIIIGIKNAVLLRTTSKAFDTAIMEAICVSQVVEIHDPCTPTLPFAISNNLAAKIMLVKSRSNLDVTQDFLVVINNVNQRLDALTGEKNDVIREKRHLAVAAMIVSTHRFRYTTGQVYDPTWDAQNLFCGAIVIGDLPLVKTLLEERQTSNPPVEVNVTTPYFHKPLSIAARLGRLKIVRYLLEKGARSDIECECETKCCTARKFENGNLDKETNLLLWRFQRSELHLLSPPSALQAAVMGGKKDVLQELLLPEYRLPRCKMEYITALLIAAQINVQAIYMILDAMEGTRLSDFTGLVQEMLWLAISRSRQEVVQMLLDDGCVTVNEVSRFPLGVATSPLALAARLGKTDMMRFFLDRGADIHLNGHDRTGESPIEEAAGRGQEAAVEMLLDLGADPELALKSAVTESQPRITKLVLDRYPDLLDRHGGQVGRLALWYAVTRKNLRNIKLLVDRGVSLNDGYEKAWEIPINEAKDGKGRWVVDYLLSLGARDTDDKTLDEDCSLTTARVRLTERTWQWVGKY